jgi:putative hemolysin
MDCKPGTMDCGQGSCVCENKKCSAKMESITQIANPASVYCEEKGNKLEIRTDEDGDQIGICILADGKECEEWKFFRGES